jgi:DNA repair protein SbcC/Rad50
VESDRCETARGGSRLRLVSLQAQNFKKLKISKPLPLSEGIILITGLNESGKSTILDAVLYALFGRVIRPSKMPSNEDIISYGNGEAQVRLEFDIGEIRYRVVREVHKTRPNRASLVEVKPNGTTKALASSVKDVTAEIERLLGGITYDEIVASSVVAQKDLERLIKQRLDDRRKVINVFLNLESFNKVQDQLDSERNGIEGTSRTPGHLTVERERLETLNEQLNEYKDTSVQLDSLNVKVEKLKKDQQQQEKQFVDTDNLYKTLNEYGEAFKQRDSLQREIEDKSLLTNNLQQQLATVDTQRAELTRAEAEVKKYADLADAEKAITRASEVLEKVRGAELQKVQFEEREQRLQLQIVETNKKITSADESQIASSARPRRIWTYLIATAAFGAGAVLSFLLTFATISVVLGSLAVVSLLLLTRQIVSLSQQADASKQQQERLASAQLVASWGNELEEVKKNRDMADVTIRQGSSQILQVLSAIPSYSSYLEGLNDPREIVDQASLIYNQDKQSLSAVTERVNMLQKRLGEEPMLKQQLAQARLDIATVERRLKNTPLPSLPAGVEFSPELLDEASQMRDSLNESVSRVKTQIEESMTRIIELKQYLEENKGLEEQVDEQKRKVLL